MGLKTEIWAGERKYEPVNGKMSRKAQIWAGEHTRGKR
ncbi:hypothetical protein SAMN05216238_101143 [Lentibacillus persicus]|uniref:Uncharacterized protein n=1 Tax=Lentibacillus persicus TaxID=640948 RepID=A0A1I1RZW4_9BACI|nr:hypothetical protein SAMN05216238_101143 [Lentibacillus persicus]